MFNLLNKMIAFIMLSLFMIGCGSKGSSSSSTDSSQPPVQTKKWSTAALVEQNSSNTYSPKVAVSINGDVIVVWINASNPEDEVVAKNFNLITGLWGNEVIIGGGASFGTDPEIINAIAVWEQYDGTSKSIFANRFNISIGQWESEKLLENGSGWAMRPQVAMNSSGNAMTLRAHERVTGHFLSLHCFKEVRGRS